MREVVLNPFYYYYLCSLIVSPFYSYLCLLIVSPFYYSLFSLLLTVSLLFMASSYSFCSYSKILFFKKDISSDSL